MVDEHQRPSIAVLFADISGSVGIYASKGDTVAFKLNDSCLRIIEGEVRKNTGREIKRAGDAVLAVFDSPSDAVRAATGMVVATDDPTGVFCKEGVLVRVGISYGTVVEADGDVYGDQVNIAARLTSLAGPGEILLTDGVYNALSRDMQEASRLINQIALRGRAVSVPVYRYRWTLEEDATIMNVGSTAAPAKGPRPILSVKRGSESFAVEPERPKLRIGRKQDNELVIDDDVVSRHHAEIALRGDKFVLTDRSMNGTTVSVHNGPTLRVCREEMVLVGSGQIAFGEEGGPVLEYCIEFR
jgi:class 3 adenylate cyclase